MSVRRRLAAVGAPALAVVLLAPFALAWTGGARAPSELLPDLEQAAPSRLEVTTAGSRNTPRYLLGFASAVDNVGAGPLEIVGERPSTSTPHMRVEQAVLRSDGARTTYPVRTIIRYVHSETHQHWHLLRFDRYELRRADTRRRVALDRKTGFCLGDRYQARVNLPNQPRAPVWEEECGRDEPHLLRIEEGISVGYGDDYKPTLEGQHFDVTRLPASRYLLVHRANADRMLRESNHANNAASLLFRLRWPRGDSGPPHVRVLRVCPDSDRCQ